MLLLFSGHPLEAKRPDPAFGAEVDAAKRAGFSVGLVNTDIQFGAEVRLTGVPKGCGMVLYRGWILKAEEYGRMEESVAGRGLLVTSLDAYLDCYYLPRWYEAIGGAEVTPRSVWLPGSSFDLDEVATYVATEFGQQSLLVKDYVKSRKHEWYDACFIASAADAAEVRRVVHNFLEGQGDCLVGGLVFREFVELKRIGLHSKSRLPLVNEHRFFVFRGDVFYQAPYWSEGDYRGPRPSLHAIESLVPRVPSPFYAIDVAETVDGRWRVIELNDGGSAGIPEGGNAEDFYRALAKIAG